MSDRARDNENGTGLAGVLDTWREWGLALVDRPRMIEPIPGGRTNRNYRLDAPGLADDLLLRINHPASEKLGIDRDREKAILAMTAAAGITRPFWYWDPAQRFVVFPYLPGRTWRASDLEDPAQHERLWPLIERLHALSPEGPRRRYHDYIGAYWAQLEAAGRVDHELRQAWQDFQPRLKAFDKADWPARLVHHDLIADNIIEADDGLYVIDWEYAAAGHPDIDIWSVDPTAVREPFVAEMMEWINGLWERLIPISQPD
jgi:thiamine kinase-like enzyme